MADVLFGDYNPSGHLSITIPRHVGQLPAYYNYKPSVLNLPLVDMSSEPLFPFGHGLSYTAFSYSNLLISAEPPATRIGTDSKVRIRLDVRNSGDRKGEEVVQLYLTDVVASVTTPVKSLKGFLKIFLDPGETKTLDFILTPYDLSLINRDLHRVVEPGVFEVEVGRSSQDIRLRDRFQVLDR